MPSLISSTKFSLVSTGLGSFFSVISIELSFERLAPLSDLLSLDFDSEVSEITEDCSDRKLLLNLELD